MEETSMAEAPETHNLADRGREGSPGLAAEFHHGPHQNFLLSPSPSSPSMCHLTLLTDLLKRWPIAATPLRGRETYLTRNLVRNTLTSGVTVFNGEGERIYQLLLHPNQAAVWRNPNFGRGRRKPQLAK
jgi:hypothetical protein